MSEQHKKNIAKQVNRNLQQRKTTINLTSAMIEAKADLEKALLDSHEPAASGESMDDKRSRDEEEIAKAEAADTGKPLRLAATKSIEVGVLLGTRHYGTVSGVDYLKLTFLMP